MLVVLNVLHKGTPRMCGKTIQSPFDPLQEMFYHASGKGDQWHFATDSPGGVDTVVLRWLRERGISAIAHHDTTRGVLFVTDMATMLAKGVVESSGGRTRCYLSATHWHPYPLADKRRVWFYVPHLTQEVTLDPHEDDNAEPAPKRKVEVSVDPRQQSLF